MKIERSGSGAFHGVSSVQFQAPKFSWHAGNEIFQIKQNKVKDFNTGSRHDYVISMSLEELGKLVQAAADAAMQDPAAFAPQMGELLSPLMQLQAVGSGVVRV